MHLAHYALAALSAGVTGIQAGSHHPTPLSSGPLGPLDLAGPSEPPPPSSGSPQRHKRSDRLGLAKHEDEEHERGLPKLKGRSNMSKLKDGSDLFKRGGYDDGCGYAKVVNNCRDDVFLWSVAYDTDGPYKIGCGEEYREPYDDGGVALEIVWHEDDWYDDCEKLVFYYKLADHDEIYYDLYEKYGHPFEGHRVSLVPDERDCPSQIWDDGCGDGGYDKKCCDDDQDLVLYLCDGDDDDDDDYDDDYWFPPPPPPPHHGGNDRGGSQWDDYENCYDYDDCGFYEDDYDDYSDYKDCYPDYDYPCYGDDGYLLRRRSLDGAEGQEATKDPNWHSRQWENDKPDWDTDAKCTDCGKKEKGSVTTFVSAAEAEKLPVSEEEPGGK